MRIHGFVLTAFQKYTNSIRIGFGIFVACLTLLFGVIDLARSIKTANVGIQAALGRYETSQQLMNIQSELEQFIRVSESALFTRIYAKVFLEEKLIAQAGAGGRQLLGWRTKRNFQTLSGRFGEIEYTVHLDLIVIMAITLGLIVYVFMYWFSNFQLNRLQSSFVVIAEEIGDVVEKIRMIERDLWRMKVLPEMNSENVVLEESRILNNAISSLGAEILRLEKEALEAQARLSFVAVARQVAHDIKSPLSAMRILHDIPGELNSEQRKLFGSAVARMEDICSDLLRVTRGHKFKGDLVTRIELGATLESLVNERQFQNRVRALEYRRDVGVFPLLCRRSDLERALSNILGNALEAAGPSGSVKVFLGTKGEYYSITVEDSGPGWPDDVLKNFAEEGQSVGKSEVGSGLGLFHARTVFEALGGELCPERSTDLGGASVVIRIRRK